MSQVTINITSYGSQFGSVDTIYISKFGLNPLQDFPELYEFKSSIFINQQNPFKFQNAFFLNNAKGISIIKNQVIILDSNYKGIITGRDFMFLRSFCKYVDPISNAKMKYEYCIIIPNNIVNGTTENFVYLVNRNIPD